MLQAAWVAALSKEDFGSLGPLIWGELSSEQVCGYHFADSDYKTYKREQLKPGVLPTQEWQNNSLRPDYYHLHARGELSDSGLSDGEYQDSMPASGKEVEVCLVPGCGQDSRIKNLTFHRPRFYQKVPVSHIFARIR